MSPSLTRGPDQNGGDRPAGDAGVTDGGASG
jgi:hypothetical protein